MNRFHKNILTLLTGNGLAQLLPMLAALILARLYSPADFGAFSNFMAVLSLFVIVACGRMDLAILLPEHDETAIDVIRKALFFLRRVLILALLVSLFFAQTLAELFESPNLEMYFRALPLFVLLNGLFALAYNWLNRKGEYRLLASSKIVMAVIIVVFNIALGYLGLGVAGLILANLLGLTAVLFVFRKQLSVLRKQVLLRKGLPLAEVSERYRDFPRVNLLHAFFDVANQQFLFNLIFTSLFGLVPMGLYAFSYRYIRGPMSMVAGSISQVYYQEASAQAASGQTFEQIFLRTLKTALFFAVPFLLILWFFAPVLFALVFGEEWREAGEYARMLAPAIAMQFLVSPVSHTPIIAEKQKAFFLVSLGIQFLSLAVLALSALFFELDTPKSLLAYSLTLSICSLFTLFWFYFLTQNKRT